MLVHSAINPHYSLHSHYSPLIRSNLHLSIASTMSSSSQVDISALKIIDTDDGAFVLRDDTDQGLQAIFDEWYASKQYWLLQVEDESTAKTTKIRNMRWDTEKSSKIWGVFQQGAMQTDGRPVIICVLCSQAYSHSALVGTSTASSHLTRERHMKKAREFLHADPMSKLPVDHDALVKKLREEGRGGVFVSSCQRLGDVPRIADTVTADSQKESTTRSGYCHRRIRPTYLESLCASRLSVGPDTVQQYNKYRVSPRPHLPKTRGQPPVGINLTPTSSHGV